MIIFVIIIAAIVVWYCISAEKERIAKQKAQQNQKKVQDELAAKVKEAEALIPRVVSSDFYKKVLSYIQSEIFKRDEAIRHQVEQDYDIYLRSSHGEESFFLQTTADITEALLSAFLIHTSMVFLLIQSFTHLILFFHHGGIPI